MIGPGRSPVIARRESVQLSSSEKTQLQENQPGSAPRQSDSCNGIDDDHLHRREDLDDPEQEFLLRLEERHGNAVDRHAILQCATGDLKSYSDLEPFLKFDKKQTTAPSKLRNPAGHYRRAVQKFYEVHAKKHDWDMHEQMRALEARIGLVGRVAERPTCSLSRCNGTGEVYDSAGLVSACDCPTGQKLAPEVLALFETVNAHARAVQRP